MKIDSAQAQIQQSNQEMFNVIRQAQQHNQDTANKMIRLSVEQKIAGQKSQLIENMVDIYI